MGKFKDLTGQTFGRLTVIERVGVRKNGHILWKCVCNCPEPKKNEVIVDGNSLQCGNTKSCGCIKSEMLCKRNRKHGLYGTKSYKTWQDMKARCYNLNDPGYKDWGGRGITVHKAWKDNFQAFYEDVSKLPHFGEEGYTLDRINNDTGNYEPGNVRWATDKEQSNNRRSNHLIEYKGKTQTMKQWAEELEINYQTLARRINTYHWSIEKALSTP